jgi:hypothetical protein
MAENNNNIQNQQVVQILLSEVGLDEQLAGMLKTFYKSNKPEVLGETLSSVVAKKEQEIEKICNIHYQEFVTSVEQLLQVRHDVGYLQAQVSKFQDSFGETTQPLLSGLMDYENYSRIAENVESLVLTVNRCLYVLELAKKINFQIENKKYYMALNILEELQRLHLRKVIQFEFAKHIRKILNSKGRRIHTNYSKQYIKSRKE